MFCFHRFRPSLRCGFLKTSHSRGMISLQGCRSGIRRISPPVLRNLREFVRKESPPVFLKKSLRKESPPSYSPFHWTETLQKLRACCFRHGWKEVSTQDRLGILYACEDPYTVVPFTFEGKSWPLPQSKQLSLEEILLQNPSLLGVFTVSTSYRDEPHPIPGRHRKIFPMFEFESHGTMEDLIEWEKELLEDLGLKKSFPEVNYEMVAQRYHVQEIGSTEEAQMEHDIGEAVFLKHFPERTDPFWNMKRVHGIAKKVDVILHGQETIGSAERSTDPEAMRHQFHTLGNGAYAQKLYELFGKDRVEAELDHYLSHRFFPRYGAGIGIDRLIRALTESGLLS